MANVSQKASATRPLSKKPPARDALHSLLTDLKSLGTRSGAAVGDIYALAATAFLVRREQLEDRNAERSFRKRSKAQSDSTPSSQVAATSSIRK